MRIALLVSLLCTALAAHLHELPIEHRTGKQMTGQSMRHHRQDAGLGVYEFGYNEQHGGGGSSRQESRNALGQVFGQYTINVADGRQRMVKYIADGLGFRAHVITNEPGTAPSLPAHVNMNMEGGPTIKDMMKDSSIDGALIEDGDNNLHVISPLEKVGIVTPVKVGVDNPPVVSLRPISEPIKVDIVPVSVPAKKTLQGGLNIPPAALMPINKAALEGGGLNLKPGISGKPTNAGLDLPPTTTAMPNLFKVRTELITAGAAPRLPRHAHPSPLAAPLIFVPQYPDVMYSNGYLKRLYPSFGRRINRLEPNNEFNKW